MQSVCVQTNARIILNLHRKCILKAKLENRDFLYFIKAMGRSIDWTADLFIGRLWKDWFNSSKFILITLLKLTKKKISGHLFLASFMIGNWTYASKAFSTAASTNSTCWNKFQIKHNFNSFGIF